MAIQRKIGAFLMLLGLMVAFIYSVMLIISFFVYRIPPNIVMSVRVTFVAILVLAIAVMASVKQDKPEEMIIDKKSRKFMKFFFGVLSVLISVGIIWIFIGYIPVPIQLQFGITAIFTIVFILFMMLSMPHVADKLVSDQKGGKIIVLGYHIHEGFIGIIFIVNALWMIIFQYNLFDTVAGIMFLGMGSFLVGRDAEDVRNFKIIVNVKKEKANEEG